MRDAKTHMDTILSLIKKRGCILMLDYDGVLAPIVRHPNHSAVSQKTRDVLRTVSRIIPTVVVSGRSVRDVAHRIRISNIRYVGSHGMEFAYRGVVQQKRVDRQAAAQFGAARQALLRCARNYRGIAMSDKYCSFAVNYRGLRGHQAAQCRDMIRKILRPFAKEGSIRVVDNLMTIEIMPKSAWTKGESAAHVYSILTKRTSRKPVPVYIGDGLTDEDAFKAFKAGITIRVGKHEASAARYYFKERLEVDTFLAALKGADKI
jgi:trehalose-phosphatase